MHNISQRSVIVDSQGLPTDLLMLALAFVSAKSGPQRGVADPAKLLTANSRAHSLIVPLARQR